MMALLMAFFALIFPVSLVAQMAQNYPVQLKWHGVETERFRSHIPSFSRCADGSKLSGAAEMAWCGDGTLW